MDFQTLTRCPLCLDLTHDRTEGCITNHAGDADKRAARLLHTQGYIVQEGVVKYVINDDPDNYQLAFIADALGLVDTYHALEQADWPQRSDWECPACGEGRVSTLGEICAFCQLEQAEESDGRRRWRLLP